MSPAPPLALNVTVAVVPFVGGGVVEPGAVGVTEGDGAEYALLPNLLTAATTKRYPIPLDKPNIVHCVELHRLIAEFLPYSCM
jgi:hypothetical protein